LLVSHGNRYIEVFEVADYESVVRFSKFKVADPMADENSGKSTILMKIGT